MGSKRQTAEETHENLHELLDWQFAERNDRAVAQALHRGEGVDTVYGLDDVGLLDGFFAFLDETGIKVHWQTLVIEGARHLLVPAILFVLLYGTRVLFGIESSNALPALLFSNVAAMTLIGFNAEQVADGMSKRGAKQRTAASEYTLMDPQTLTEPSARSVPVRWKSCSMARSVLWPPLACLWPRSWWRWMVRAW